MITLNHPEEGQLDLFTNAIRSDKPNNPQPARNFVPLIRCRVCAFLVQEIKAGHIRDIYVVHTPYGDLYAHI